MHNRYQVTSDVRDFLNKASSLLEFSKLEATNIRSIFDVHELQLSLLFNQRKRINVNNPRKQATQNAFAIQSIGTPTPSCTLVASATDLRLGECVPRQNRVIVIVIAGAPAVSYARSLAYSRSTRWRSFARPRIRAWRRRWRNTSRCSRGSDSKCFIVVHAASAATRSRSVSRYRSPPVLYELTLRESSLSLSLLCFFSRFVLSEKLRGKFASR